MLTQLPPAEQLAHALETALREGRFEIEGNGPLFVSRGIGCAGIPLRVRADPELLICTVM